MFNAIRDCNIFLEKVDGVHDLSQDELKRWKGEVIFLKAYYHYLLLRAYGPIPLMDENIEVSAPAEAMAVGRIPFDSCVNYVNNLLEESAGMLPLKVDKETTEAGRVTKSVALTIRAQLLTMAASPLFNGNIDYTNVIDRNGVSLFNVVADPKKWERAAKACQDAIEETQLAKRKLYEDRRSIIM
ncbi:RagB/SusD family nutrient uptake outer membrane protein [Bacteroides faecichinchillae]|uniref:RagB/SusD family nutrient uptake outer membrane protein n=1 Tax=Bacteroides faecichinchillae TaxID=871325 RepID=UPI0023B96EE8|nr:RagB/SusD family nutrient uptake outer membrane protein [Bacteroides faecichinchillae]